MITSHEPTRQLSIDLYPRRLKSLVLSHVPSEYFAQFDDKIFQSDVLPTFSSRFEIALPTGILRPLQAGNVATDNILLFMSWFSLIIRLCHAWHACLDTFRNMWHRERHLVTLYGVIEFDQNCNDLLLYDMTPSPDAINANLNWFMYICITDKKLSKENIKEYFVSYRKGGVFITENYSKLNAPFP